jgi:hypothetical protein
MKTKIKIMKKLLLLIAFISMVQISSFSQQCLPEGYDFQTQAEIDSFPINYPNCTQIEGSVIIRCGADIHNLSGFSKITTMGHLFIWGSTGTDSLKSLAGLENVRTLGGLKINFADGLKNLTGLDNLSLVNGDVEILYSGFTSFSGLENLIAINGGIYIGDNDSLKSFSGLNNLNLVKGSCKILFNNSLKNLAGLDNLRTIEGFITIGLNDSLTSLDGLDNLTTLLNNLQIVQNNQLTSLSGIKNIAPTYDYLFIVDNPLLSACEVKSICDYVANPNGPIVIHDNAEGCNNQDEVEDACAAIGISELFDGRKVLIHPNPCNTTLSLDFEKEYNDEEVFFKIYSVSGQLIKAGGFNMKNNNTLDVTQLVKGFYLIQLNSDKSSYLGKFVKL